MKQPLFASRASRITLSATIFLCLAAVAVCAWFLRPRVFWPDSRLDEKTYVAPSRIPGAGNGLFAARPIARGEIIAEMGGELVFEDKISRERRGYLFAAPSCALRDIWPYTALDGRRAGGHASRINFAPSRINGVPTNLQNARGLYMCRRPYVYFEAVRDIARDEEILASYGAIYDYEFMSQPQVQAYFCRITGIDCRQGFSWEP